MYFGFPQISGGASKITSSAPQLNVLSVMSDSSSSPFSGTVLELKTAEGAKNPYFYLVKVILITLMNGREMRSFEVGKSIFASYYVLVFCITRCRVLLLRKKNSAFVEMGLFPYLVH